MLVASMAPTSRKAARPANQWQANQEARHTSKNTMPQKLTRAQIRAGLDQVPIQQLLSSGEGKQPKITGKMKAFAHAVALGETKANAYRKAYKQTATKRTLASKPYELMRDERIQREAEAYRLAIETAEHRTAGQLKALLVQQLVQHSLDKEFPPAQRMKALHLIGQLFEVGAFLEQKQTTVIHKSSDIRARLLDRLQARAPSAGPAADALDLLQEIRGAGISQPASGAPTAPGAPPAGPPAPRALSHTVSDIQSIESNVSDVLEKKVWGGVQKKPDTVLDFDKE